MEIVIGGIWFAALGWVHARVLISPARRKAQVAFYLERSPEYRQALSVFIKGTFGGWVINAGAWAMSMTFWMVLISKNTGPAYSSAAMLAASILLGLSVILFAAAFFVGYTGKPERWILPEYKVLLKALKEDQRR